MLLDSMVLASVMSGAGCGGSMMSQQAVCTSNTSKLSNLSSGAHVRDVVDTVQELLAGERHCLCKLRIAGRVACVLQDRYGSNGRRFWRCGCEHPRHRLGELRIRCRIARILRSSQDDSSWRG